MRVLFIISLFLSSSLVGFSQSACPPNPLNISTNPNKPSPANSGYQTNSFDWTSNYYYQKSCTTLGCQTGWSQDPTYSCTYGPGCLPLTNPFYEVGSDIAADALSDFQPFNGWELVKKDFGYLTNGTHSTATPGVYYLLLYNKYSGKLRVLISLQDLSGNPGTSQQIVATLSMPQKDQCLNKYSVSGLLNHYNTNCSQPMNQTSNVLNVSSTITTLPDDVTFVYADFQLAYDPCTCQNYSALNITFAIENTSKINLYGRLLGTEEPVTDNIGDADYLSSLYTDPTISQNAISNTVSAGMLTYNNINTLAQNYQQSLDAYQASQASDDGFLSVLSAGTGFVSSALSAAALLTPEGDAFKLGYDFVTDLPTLVANQNTAEAKFGNVATGLNTIASMSNFFSSDASFNVDGGSAPVMPMMIHGEMSITGTLTSSNNLFGTTIFIGNPGSPANPNATDNSSCASNAPPCSINATTPVCTTCIYPEQQTACKPSYPVYNEVLGTFALLNTPDLYQGSKLLSLTGNCNDISTCDVYTNLEIGFHIDPSTINYVFNPKIDVDMNSTVIKAAFVMQGFSLGVGQNMHQLGDTTLISDFYTLDELYGVNFSVFAGDVDFLSYANFYIRFYIDFASNPDPNYQGLIHRAFQVFTYRLNLKDASLLPPYPNNQNISSIPTSFPSPCDNVTDPNWCPSNSNFLIGPVTIRNDYVSSYNLDDYYVLGDILIENNQNDFIIPYNSDNKFRIHASGTIQVQQGVIFDQGTVLEVVDPYNLTFSYPTVGQTTQDLSGFCKGTSPNPYQANVPTTRREVTATASTTPTPAKTPILKSSVQAAPNPANGKTTFYVKIPGLGATSLYITNPLGEKVRDILVNQTLETGLYQYEADLSNLQEGVYFYTFGFNGATETHRLVVLK